MANATSDRQPSPTHALIVGIDEAGYGPRLGPLCVAASAFTVTLPTPSTDHTLAPRESDDAPLRQPIDLWALLAPALAREPKAHRAGRVVVADSKSLMGKRDRSLEMLERGVLAFATLLGLETHDDEALRTALGARPFDQPWYAGAAQPLPRDEDPTRQSLLARAVAQACESARVFPAMLRCAALDEERFNNHCEREGLKSRVSFALVASHLAAAWERVTHDTQAIVAVDRQGGRSHYLRELAQALPGAGVSILSETDHRSHYAVRGSGGRRMTVEFTVGAEDLHFPVALASMTAKYLRELAMARFNRYWCTRVPGLKPTAGYARDASRWLADVRPHARADELDAIVRRL